LKIDKLDGFKDSDGWCTQMSHKEADDKHKPSA
jgi:hypothetical protein